MYQLLESLQIYLSSLGFQCGMDLALAVQVKSWLTGLVLAEERRIVVPFLVLDLYTTYILLIYYLYTTYILLIYYLYTIYWHCFNRSCLFTLRLGDQVQVAFT